MSKIVFFPSCIFGLFLFISFFSSSQKEDTIYNTETMNYHFMIHNRSLKNGDTITKYIYLDCRTGEECLYSIREKSIKDNFQVLEDTLIQSEHFVDPFAQKSLFGKIVDEKTEAPLGDVLIEYFANSKKKSIRTSNDGVFEINLSGVRKSSKIKIKALGKENKTFLLSEAIMNEFITIPLKDKGVTSVTASRWEQSIYEIPASTIVISREEIEQNGYLTLQEILENVPGFFTIDQRYASGVTIGIRGFWTDFSRNVMIQLNGINMLNDRRNDYPLDKINVAVESIDKIEIVRGPMSVIYGDGAFFGVINIITNDSQSSASSSFTTGYGTQNTLKETFRYALNENGLNLALNAMIFHREGFNEQWRDMISESLAVSDSTAFGSDFKFPNAVTLSDYYFDTENPDVNPERYSRKFKSFNLSMSYNGFFSNINFSNSNSGFSYKAVGPGNRNDYTTRTSNYQFGYRNRIKKIGNGLDWQLKTEYMTSRGNQISNRYVDTMLIIGEDRISSIRTEFNTRYSFISNPMSKFKLDLISGFYYNFNYENGTFYNAPDINYRNWFVGLDPKEGRLTTTAGYAQLEIKINRLQIIGGFRISQQGAYKMLNEENVGYYGDSLTGSDLGWEGDTSPISFQRQNEIKPAGDVQFIPRLAAIYNLNINDDVAHYFKAMYGEAQNEINVVQNAFDIMRTNANLTPAQLNDFGEYSYLSPEKIQTIELGHTYVNRKINFELNTNLFLNILDDLITRDTYQSNGVYVGYSANSRKRIVSRGVEFIGKQTFNLNTPRRKINLAAQGSITLQSTKSLEEKRGFNDYFNQLGAVDQQEYNDALLNNDTNDIDSYADDLYPTSFSPPILANFNTTLYIGLKNEAYLTVNFGGNYVGPMWGQSKFASVLLSDSTNQQVPSYYGDSQYKRIKGYWRTSLNVRVGNLHISKENKSKEGGYFVNLKISNLFDSRYKYPNHSYTAYLDRGVYGRRRQIVGTVGFKF